MVRTSPWWVRLCAGSLAAALLFGCGSDAGPRVESRPAGPTAAATSMLSGAVPPVSRAPLEAVPGARFTPPVETEFRCDCPSRLLGTNGAERAAILRSLPLPGGPPGEPSVQVLDADGRIVWRFDDLELPTSDPAVAATSVLPLDEAIVAPTTGGYLVGLDWTDGSRLWELADVSSAPRRVPQHPDLFTITVTGFEVHNGSSYSTHRRVSVREASTGEPRWAGTSVDAFTVADDGSRLLAVRFGDEAAELIRVELPSGTASSVMVPGWQGRGTSLQLNADGTVSSDIGDNRFTVRVDWDGPEPAVDDLGTGWTVAREDVPSLPPDAEVIARHEETGTLLGSTVDGAGHPVTVFAADASGTRLWERPAAEVASWSMRKDGHVAFKNVSIHDAGARDAVVMLDLRWGFDELRGAADAARGPASLAYDLRTGTDLWEWGRSTHSGGQTIIREHGLVLVAEAGPLDETGAVAEPAPLRAALLDLRTGAPEWEMEAGAVTSVSVASDGAFAFLAVRDGPWLLSTQQDG